MQKPDFEIVVELLRTHSLGPLLTGAAFAVVTQGAKYITYSPEEYGSALEAGEIHIYGWREKPEGWRAKT